MSEIQETQIIEQNDKFPFWKFIYILLRWKKFITINVFVLSLISVGISLLLPLWFKSTASILPPKEQDMFGMFGGASSLLQSLGGKAFGQNVGTYSYLAILKSRNSMEKVIQKFNLISVYEEENIDKTIEALEDNVSFEVQNDGNITIEVFDKSPKRAANIANYFVEILNSTSIQLGTQEAKNNREFIENRLNQCRNDLKNSEDSLSIFQKNKSIIISPDEKSSAISAYAELYALKAKREIEIDILKKTVNEDNQQLKQKKIELEEISKKLSSFPQTGVEGFRLYREIMIQQKILEFLLPLYEQAKINEQKDIPVLLVLDKAAPAIEKSKPKRSIVVLVVFFISFFTFTFLSISMDKVISETSTQETYTEKKLRDFTHSILNIYKMNL